jgi:GcrA cell cycle regulator
MASIWNEERSNDLAARLANGETFRNIGAELSIKYNVTISRSSCIGRAHRMGLESLHKPGETSLTDVPKVKKPKRERPVRVKTKTLEHRPVYSIVQNGGGGFRIHESRTSDLPNLRCIEIEPLHLTLDQVVDVDGCRYPYGGDREGDPITFCGHTPKKKDKSYCLRHCDLVFTEPKPRKPQTYVNRSLARAFA